MAEYPQHTEEADIVLAIDLTQKFYLDVKTEVRVSRSSIPHM